tara:strand:+ start:565 stop:828 length:264 start_codon:yes stop_codon:yes gene_type:complete
MEISVFKRDDLIALEVGDHHVHCRGNIETASTFLITYEADYGPFTARFYQHRVNRPKGVKNWCDCLRYCVEKLHFESRDILNLDACC